MYLCDMEWAWHDSCSSTPHTHFTFPTHSRPTPPPSHTPPHPAPSPCLPPPPTPPHTRCEWVTAVALWWYSSRVTVPVVDARMDMGASRTHTHHHTPPHPHPTPLPPHLLDIHLPVAGIVVRLWRWGGRYVLLLVPCGWRCRSASCFRSLDIREFGPVVTVGSPLVLLTYTVLC